MPFSALLARWVSDASRRWSPEAVAQAERAVADTVACMIAGAGDAAVSRVRQGLGGWGSGGRSTVIGRSDGLDAPWAALVNGTAAHALDYDDVLDPAASHVSAVLVPALLALGEEVGASGADLVDAYIVGVEVQECLAEGLNMDHYTRGWHTTLTLGAPAAAAACARLLRLDAAFSLAALSLATSHAAGFKRQFGTNAKPLHAGLAAKHGIVCARMAAAGLTADPAPFEGERGFLALLAGPGAAGFDGVLDRLTRQPAVVAPGVWLKRYPCCASTHRAVDGLLDLMDEERLGAGDIASVQTEVSEAAVRNLMYDRPANEMQARFSMPYCIAAAALDGDLRLDTFGQASLGRADIAAFMPRVRMHTDPAQPADMPSTTKSWATTKVATRDGRTFERRVVDPRGYPDRPLSEADLARKFADCARGQPAEIAAGFAAWRHIDTCKHLDALYAGLRTLNLERPG